MSKVYVKKKHYNKKKLKKLVGAILATVGLSIALYIFFPLISYEIFLAPVLAAQNVQAPIPQTTVVDAANLGSLFASINPPLIGKNYDDATNWFPSFSASQANADTQVIKSYKISIPAIHVADAIVSTQDTDLSKHLVNLASTAIPPNKGNAVIFGHSTIQAWFDPTNYHTILANAIDLKVGDTIIANVNGNSYLYRITTMTVVPPTDTTMLTQEYNDSYITLVTCTPPGTTWKRLIIRAKMENV